MRSPIEDMTLLAEDDPTPPVPRTAATIWPLRQVFEPIAPRARQLRACALAGALDGRWMAAEGPADCIDHAIIDGRVSCHARLWKLGPDAALAASRAYRSTLNL